MDVTLAQFVVYVVIGLLSAGFAAGGAYLAVKTELKYMRRDIDRNTMNIDMERTERLKAVELLHERISRLHNRLPD